MSNKDITFEDIDIDTMLKNTVGELKEGVIIGMDQEGNLWIASSNAEDTMIDHYLELAVEAMEDIKSGSLKLIKV